MFFPFLPSCSLLSSDCFSLSCPRPLCPIESGFDCTMENTKSATLYFSTIKNGCVLPLFVHLGATLPCFKVLLCQQGWRIPKAMSDLELCDKKTSMVYLFFIQINKISIFWLTTDNFHFRNPLSGALMFCFVIIGDFSKELLKQWQCWRNQG